MLTDNSGAPLISDRNSAVLLDRAIDVLFALGQIIGVHHRLELDAGVERQEPRLGGGGYLRRILHVEKDVPRSLPIVVGEVGCFWLEVSKDGLNLFTEAAVPGRCIPRINGDR